MKVKKRKKNTRMRGSHTHFWGFKKKHRGKGHKGGTGMSGSGKRGYQKKQFAQRLAEDGVYFGKRGFTSKPSEKFKEDVINLKDISKKYSEKEINLEGYKILGDGEGFKATITAESASKSAIEKMEKAGGKIIVKNKMENKEKAESKEVKENKKAEKKSA